MHAVDQVRFRLKPAVAQNHCDAEPLSLLNAKPDHAICGSPLKLGLSAY